MKASVSVLMALVIFSLPALAQEFGGGVLRGQVLPAQGETELPGIVTVRIVGAGFQQVTYVSGNYFSFQGLRDGDYTIYVSANGREEVAQELQGFSADRSDMVTIIIGNRAPDRDVPPAGNSVVDLKTLQVPDKAKEQLQKGLDSLHKEDFDQAAKHFRAALQIAPDFYQAHNNLGVALIKLQKPEDAEKEFARATEIEPNNLAGLKNLGYVRMNLGRHQQAIEPLARAVRLDANDATAEMFLGEAYTMVKDSANAKDHFLKAVLLNAGLAHADYRLGYIFLREKQYDQALKYFQGYLKSNPDEKGKEEVQPVVAKLEQYFKDNLDRVSSSPSP